MAPPRIYHPGPLATGQTVTLTDRAGRHLVKALRLTPPAPVTLFNGDGIGYAGALERTAPDVGVRITGAGEPEPAAPLHITLAQAIAKGDRMDFAIQKAVELGVAQIIPLFTARTVVRLSGTRLRKRYLHWLGVVESACEQCGRNRLPGVTEPLTLDEWLADPPPGLRLALLPDGGEAPRRLQPPPDGRVTLLIGPEGGLAPEELAAATRQAFAGLRLGPRILRTETAPLAAVAVLQALWGDLGG